MKISQRGQSPDSGQNFWAEFWLETWLGFPDAGGSAQARALMIDALGSQGEQNYNYHEVEGKINNKMIEIQENIGGRK
jgi:hypothetical protein